MNLYNSIEETKENNNKKFNDMKENVKTCINIDIDYTKAIGRGLPKARDSSQ